MMKLFNGIEVEDYFFDKNLNNPFYVGVPYVKWARNNIENIGILNPPMNGVEIPPNTDIPNLEEFKYDTIGGVPVPLNKKSAKAPLDIEYNEQYLSSLYVCPENETVKDMDERYKKISIIRYFRRKSIEEEIGIVIAPSYIWRGVDIDGLPDYPFERKEVIKKLTDKNPEISGNSEIDVLEEKRV